MAECERDWDLHEIVSNGTYDFADQVRPARREAARRRRGRIAP